MAESHRCRRAGMSEAAAERHILDRMTRPPRPPNEVATAVRKAYNTNWQSSGPRFHHAPVPITEIEFKPDRLSQLASNIQAPQNWRHWLCERSPKLPDTQNSLSFLMNLYRPGEKVLLFDAFEAKTPLQSIEIDVPMNCRVPEVLESGGRFGKGIWYLCNPVDGQWHNNPREGKPSCRSQESVTAFRYAVLESDTAPADQWLAFLVQLPMRITAVYTSGGRSIHCLFRVDAASKAEWDQAIAPLKRPLKVLGADVGCLSAVRLTRLPGCSRPEKQGFQKLLYLCPNPPLAPLWELPQLSLGKATVPAVPSVKWNQNQEASQ